MPKTTVYLLDDEPDFLELLDDIVSITGLNAVCFTSANQFFKDVELFEPGSILVLDLNMPEMDGIEVMRRLAEQNLTPAIILMSGHDSNVLHAAEKLGHAHDLDLIASLNKPIDIDQFQDILEQHDQKNIAQENKKQNNQVSQYLTITDLEQAIHTNQLVLHYQPQLDISTGEVISAEALVRWEHPTLGLIFPDSFIPMAEESKMIGELTNWVIDEAVRQELIWQNEGISITLSVNISAIDITSLTLPEQLIKLCENKQLNPKDLTLEVTEGALMGELVTSLDILTRLRLKGFALSIDDFGTGYSSLSQLHRVPFSELKIDRSFVSNIEDDPEARAIVKTCIILGHELKMKVVAEGVETQEQFELLKQFECDIAQGYLFSKPLEQSKFKEFLLSHQIESKKLLDEAGLATPELTNIVWSDEYKVGIKFIDDDHKQLINLLGQCQSVESKVNDNVKMDKVINELIIYTKTHFKREEALMAECEYPNLEAHQKAHEKIINKVKSMHEQLVICKLARDKLILFINEWIVEHIGKQDCQMAKFCLTNSSAIDKVSKQYI